MTPSERCDKLIESLDLNGLAREKPDVQQEAKDLLTSYHEVFSLESAELGDVKGVEHDIVLTDEEPFKERFRRIAPHQVQEVRELLQEMLDAGAIRPSHSPWSNAIVLAKKKGGGLRFCIDFRRLNARTKKDAYPLPRINESLESLAGAKYFTCLDLKAGFWQARLTPRTCKYTAFTAGHLGFYEFTRMPFGLCNAPATFQRLMQNCLGELNLNYCLIYLDDIVIFSRTARGHIQRLRVVLERLREHGFKLKPQKCNLFCSEVEYLGHLVTAAGAKPSARNIAAIVGVPVPATVTDVRSFLGLANHYRRFVKGFAKIARPLIELTSGPNAGLKNAPVALDDKAMAAFEELKRALITAPVLAFAEFDKDQPFRL
jgi:hypothetical protein